MNSNWEPPCNTFLMYNPKLAPSCHRLRPNREGEKCGENLRVGLDGLAIRLIHGSSMSIPGGAGWQVHRENGYLEDVFRVAMAWGVSWWRLGCSGDVQIMCIKQWYISWLCNNNGSGSSMIKKPLVSAGSIIINHPQTCNNWVVASPSQNWRFIIVLPTVVNRYEK